MGPPVLPPTPHGRTLGSMSSEVPARPCPIDLEPEQRRLLDVLRRSGPLSAEALGKRLGISRSAIARRLLALGRTGLVTRRGVRHGVGRPVHLYDVTPDARGGSEPDEGRLAGTLLEAIRAVGGDELVARVFGAAERSEAAAIGTRLDASGLHEAPLVARVHCLADIFDERGYAADVVEERGLRLIVHACPLLDLSRRSLVICDSELRLVGLVLGALVERESNIAGGARACVYRIRAREPGYPAAVWTSGQMRAERAGGTAVSTEPARQWTATQWVGERRKTK